MSERLLVTLPFQELVDRFGPVPDGVELGVWDMDAPHPEPERVRIATLPFFFRGGRRWGHVEALPDLALLQLPSAGYEHALPHVPEHAVLANGRGIHDDETAELALAITLASFRQVDTFAIDRTHEVWDTRPSRSLAERHVLVVGHGAIGKEIADRFDAFKTHATVVARTARHQDGRDVRAFADLPSLLPSAEVVVLITPLTPETEGMVDAAFLAALPDGALVVNMSRGKVVDTDALVAELTSGRLHAGLDVTDPEPLPAGHALWTTPNTVLTPHVGGNTDLSVPRTIELVRRQAAALVEGRPFENVVTAPTAV
ncbi:2-hydroxyacid dehydrogenase [Curtobacterium sp. RRHDQ10]|uniref:2-hydroxyacid dehydrogenase n=1 Tax=Curtobacterium phyllosphaerae TaxID=3413379 RepID=UPI003BF1B287